MSRGRYKDDQLPPADMMIFIVAGFVICVGYFVWWIVSAFIGA